MPNRLISETSPYLLQHAHNPVDWHPWGEEALERARTEDRPILLSVGYSACHWCHVMERESFEDPDTARLMNAAFVNIKVDREERPDVDQIYMKAVQAMTGSGGWPLTVFLLPSQEPFYGGTYFPPEPRHGLPSFRQVLKAAADAYAERPDDVRNASRELMRVLRSRTAPQQDGGSLPDVGVLERAVDVLSRQFDPDHGGFGSAPKFPQPVTLELLLRHHLRTGDPRPLEMAVHTLRRMAAGGIRDHLGGGFHRYSVDARWLVPHFEKMLYDNALLASAYTDAFRVTGAEDLREVAEETLDYLLRDMWSPGAGFFTARDADSEGVEGAFYVWSPEQVVDVLGRDLGDLFNKAYDVAPGGNFEGLSILNRPRPLAAVAEETGIGEAELSSRLDEARSLLLATRAERVPPFRDEKIITSWNGLAIRALAEAGAILGRDDYVSAAVEATDFLLSEVRRDDRLLHTYKDGVARVDGFLEDYGSLGNALLSLYGVTLDGRWLDEIEWCCDVVLARFWDEEDGLLYDSPLGTTDLVIRPRDPMDNATPSGTSLACEMLARAAHLFDRHAWVDVVDRVLAGEAEALRRFPPAFGRLLSVLDRRHADPVEVALMGDPGSEGTRELVRATWAPFHRNLTVAGGSPGDTRAGNLPLLEGRGPIAGRPAAYVCRRYACRAPVLTGSEVTEAISAADH